MHRAPNGIPLRPLLVLGPLVVAVIVAAFVTPSFHSGDEGQTPVQVASVPADTPTSLSPSRACQDDVMKALSRYGVTVWSGGDVQALMDTETANLTPIELEAYSFALNAFAPDVIGSRREGLGAKVTRVMPRVRRVCARA